MLSTCARWTEAGRKVETAIARPLLHCPPPVDAACDAVVGRVCGRRAKVLAGRTRRPGVAIAEGSGSSERRRRRVVAAAWPREPLASTGCLRGGAPMRRFARRQSARGQSINYILSSPGICGGWGRPLSHRFHTGTAVFRVAAELGRACFKLERLGHKLATLSKGNPSIFFVQVSSYFLFWVNRKLVLATLPAPDSMCM